MSETDLRAILTARLAARLGIEPEAVDPRESFHHYGLGSAGAVGLVAELSAELGRILSPTLVWGHPSVEALARHLAGGGEAARPAASAPRRGTDEPVAVVGMACRFPGARDPREFWRMLCDGTDTTREVPADRWNPDGFYDPDPMALGTTNTRRGAFLDRIDEFDPLFFGISPREASEMDPQQRLMLELSWEALEDAGLPPRDLAGTRAGVFFGVVWRDYGDIHRAAGAPITSHSGVGQAVAIVANRVSYALGLAGPSLIVDTACSSSLVAVHLACQSLRTGDSSVALAGGVNLMLTPENMVALTKFGGLSGEGRCKAFDASADGFGRGEGAGVIVLKPLSRALADGDPIYCVIRGSAVNNDGASNGLTAPNPRAQVAVLRDAYERSGVDPARVQVVEAHGTGTPLGDPIEARALSEVLGAGRDPESPLVIGSVKTNVGHLEAAAGIAGLIKLALAIHHRTVPPSLHFNKPNPDIPFAELGLTVQTALGPWPAGDGPALGGVSSFGWGGTNCHMILEGMPGQAGREAKPQRGVGIKPGVSTPGEVPHSMASPEGAEAPAPLPGVETPGFTPAPPTGAFPRHNPGRLAFVLAGIGPQWAGMGVDLLHSEPIFRARVEECDRLFAPLTGWSIVEELIGGDRWDRVDVAVPTVFAVEVGLAALWRSWGVEPDLVIGHSAGEFAAAYLAGLLSLEDAALGAFHYSRLLELQAGRGGMGVVQLPAAEVEELGGGRLAVGGISSPESTLVAGEPGPLDGFLASVAARGLFSARVVSDVASHVPQVEPLMAELAGSLRGIVPRQGKIPMLSTVTGEVVDGPLDGAYWAQNLRRPVLFSQAVERALAQGGSTFLEVGPHPIFATPLEQCFKAFGAEAVVLPSLRRGVDGPAVLAASRAAFDTVTPPERFQVVPLSARSPEALRDLARETAVLLTGPEPGAVQDFGWTAALRRTHHEHRLAVVARTRDELAGKLQAFAGGEPVPGLAAGRSGRGERGGLVFAFSGQGPQWPGMGRQLLAEEPVFREVVERCDDLLRPWLGGSLLEIVDREADALDRTAFAQPALCVLQIGLAALWRSWGVAPTAVVGHSVGEIAAAHVAGALTLEEAVRVAAVRGRCMDPARGRGGMLAVELPEAEARGALAELGDRLSVAAVNSPASTVLAGEPAALDELAARLGKLGVTCRRLRVEYAFHSPQMEPHDAEVESGLADLRPRPVALPMISTVTGAPVAGPELGGAYWRANVRQPVRFAAAVPELAAQSTFLEVGPHPVLAVAINQSLDAHGREAAVLASLRRGRDERETMLEALGALHVQGVAVDWRGVFRDGGRQVHLPAYPFQRQRYWFTANPPPVPAPSLPSSPLSLREKGGAGGEVEVERLLAEQLDAFNRMVALQLDVLGRTGGGEV